MPPTEKQSHLLPNHVTIQEFANIKGVTRQTVYLNLGPGYIQPDIIGRAKKVTMIDLSKYLDYKFATHPNRKPEKKVTIKKDPVKK